MPILRIALKNGLAVQAPTEAWIVALVNALPPDQAAQVAAYASRAQQMGAAVLPEKYKVGEDELGSTFMQENPVIDLSGLRWRLPT